METWTKAKTWKGNDLEGIWTIGFKADGVRAFYTKEKGWHSRNGKPLYNMPGLVIGDMPTEGFEVYCWSPGRSSKENYKETITRIRAKTKDRPIDSYDLYSLSPLDVRLQYATTVNPTAKQITAWLKEAVSSGWEGLILRQEDKWLKVKPAETYDVKITGIIEGKGKHKGRLGALMTDMGKVGTGFSDSERQNLWLWHITGHSGIGDEPLISQMVEIECMQLTPDGKFRFPRFGRIRYDK